jgi:hypothetical protein
VIPWGNTTGFRHGEIELIPGGDGSPRPADALKDAAGFTVLSVRLASVKQLARHEK